MEKTPKMPPRRIKARVRSIYNLKDLIGKNDEFLKEEVAGLYVTYEDITSNLDFFNHILDLEESKKFFISCKDYESVQFIENNIKERIDERISLIDDEKNIDRSYIDLESLEKIKLAIPLPYLMWNVKANEEVLTDCFTAYNSNSDVCLGYGCANGNQRLAKEDLQKIKEEVLKLKELSPATDLDKIIIVSNHIQKNIQFIEDIESHASDGIYVVQEIPNSLKEKFHNYTGLIETVLNEKHGVCMGISNLTTMLLNNPEFNVDIRSLFGQNHVWNISNVDGKYYYLDNTWNITRNPNRIDGALQAKSFNDKYLLFGDTTAKQIGNHEAETFNSNIESLSKDDYSRKKIDEALEKMIQDPTSGYAEQSNYKSYRK